MISVVIPFFNNSATIDAALESVLSDGSESPEVIVVNDGSTGTEGEALGHGRLASRIRIIHLPSNRGPAAARNRGITEARGDWIAFLDADDVWLPKKLDRQMDLAGRYPDVALWCGGVVEDGQAERGKRQAAGGKRGGEETAGRKGEKKRNIEMKAQSAMLNAQDSRQEREGGECRTEIEQGVCPGDHLCSVNQYPVSSLPISIEDLAVSNPVATSTVMVRRPVLNAVGGFDEQFRGPEDYDLWMRIVARFSGRIIDAPLAKYRHRPGSLSMDERKFLPEVLRVLDKAFAAGGALESHRRLRGRAESEQFFSASWMAYDRGDRSRAIGWLLRSLILYPGRIGKESGDRLFRLKLMGRYLSGKGQAAGGRR